MLVDSSTSQTPRSPSVTPKTCSHDLALEVLVCANSIKYLEDLEMHTAYWGYGKIKGHFATSKRRHGRQF